MTRAVGRAVRARGRAPAAKGRPGGAKDGQHGARHRSGSRFDDFLRGQRFLICSRDFLVVHKVNIDLKQRLDTSLIALGSEDASFPASLFCDHPSWTLHVYFHWPGEGDPQKGNAQKVTSKLLKSNLKVT